MTKKTVDLKPDAAAGMSVLARLNEIREELEMSKQSSGKYKAFQKGSLDKALNPLLKKYGLAVTWELGQVLFDPIKTYDRNGNEKVKIFAGGSIKYTIKCVYNPKEEFETFELPLAGLNAEGCPSKSTGNAMSYSYKYLFLNALGIEDQETEVDSKSYNDSFEAINTRRPANHPPQSSELLNNASNNVAQHAQGASNPYAG